MLEDVFPNFAHSVSDLAEPQQVLLMDGIAVEGSRHLDCVVDVTTGTWLNALPAAFHCVLDDGEVVSSL